VHNTGTKTVDGVGLVVLGESGLSSLGDYRNCIPLSRRRRRRHPAVRRTVFSALPAAALLAAALLAAALLAAALLAAGLRH